MLPLRNKKTKKKWKSGNGNFGIVIPNMIWGRVHNNSKNSLKNEDQCVWYIKRWIYPLFTIILYQSQNVEWFVWFWWSGYSNKEIYSELLEPLGPFFAFCQKNLDKSRISWDLKIFSTDRTICRSTFLLFVFVSIPISFLVTRTSSWINIAKIKTKNGGRIS